MPLTAPCNSAVTSEAGSAEQAAIAGVLTSAIFGDPRKALEAAKYIARRLDALSEETERGWQGEFREGEGFHFQRMVRGVTEH